MKWPFRSHLSPIAQLQQSLDELQKAAMFVPTPWAVARQMLEFAQAGPQDTVYDLGSGDGRIPILAAQEFGCRAVGIEKDSELFRYSQQRVAGLNLQDQVAFLNANFFETDLRPATIVTLYLLSAVNGHLQQRLASHLRPGSRVVALDFEVPGWRACRTAAVKSEGNVDYTLHLYVRSTPGSLPAYAKSSLAEPRANRLASPAEPRQAGVAPVAARLS